MKIRKPWQFARPHWNRSRPLGFHTLFESGRRGQAGGRLDMLPRRAITSHSWLWVIPQPAEERFLAKHSNDRLQGTLDLVVLRLLDRRGPMHGYAMTQHIAHVSENVLRVQEGSLYPALHRMTQAGLLQSTWGESENGRRARYYQITPAGRRQLVEEKKKWAELTEAIARVMRHV